MKIGIIAAMPEELVYLIQHLENAQEETVLGNKYHTGKIGSVELVLVESGIGKVMSAMSVAILADHFKVDAVINTGSAGALAEGIEVGDDAQTHHLLLPEQQFVYHPRIVEGTEPERTHHSQSYRRNVRRRISHQLW